VAGLTRSEEDLLDLAENRRRSPREVRRTDEQLLALYLAGTLLVLKVLVIVF
jgi:hypothetical protein